MTQRTQRFVVLGVAILVVGLGTGLVASYVDRPPAAEGEWVPGVGRTL